MGLFQFHLHDHSGKAYLNYRLLPMIGFGSTDVSLSGMGKGDGNLKLEYAVDPSENPLIFDLIENNSFALHETFFLWAQVLITYN